MLDFLSLKLHKDLLLRYIIKMENIVGKIAVADRETEKNYVFEKLLIYKIYTIDTPSVRVNYRPTSRNRYFDLRLILENEIEMHKVNIQNNDPLSDYQYPITDMQRVLGFNNLKIESIEVLLNVTRNDANKRHRYWNLMLNPSYHENIKRKQREYNSNNKDKIKQYYVDNKDKINQRQQQYHSNNKDKINQQRQQYYIDNKNKIKQYRSQKIMCDMCDCNYNLNDKSKHNKTLKHQENLKNRLNDLNINESSKQIFKRAYILIQKQKLENEAIENEYKKLIKQQEELQLTHKTELELLEQEYEKYLMSQ
jgi:hypothetical protein